MKGSTGKGRKVAEVKRKNWGETKEGKAKKKCFFFSFQCFGFCCCEFVSEGLEKLFPGSSDV